MTLLPADTPWLLQHGDCLEYLRHLPDTSVDAVVTDPPAGIEFMGKEWDSPGTFGSTFAQHGFTDGGERLAAPAQRVSLRNPMCRKCHKHIRGTGGCTCEESEPDEDVEFIGRAKRRQRDAFVAYLQAIMVEVYRVLKPGSHALVWALPRTSHWTALALEEAGFEIRDCVFHFFGCLSDDTEILVDGRWEPYQKAVEGRLVLCYDAEHDKFCWAPIKKLYIYPHDGPLYHLYGARTDQLVTREHRCLVERAGAYTFARAEEAARQREARVPVLEDVRSLLAALSLPQPLTSGSQPDVQPGVRGEEAESGPYREAPQAVAALPGVRTAFSYQEQSVVAGEVLHAGLLRGMEGSRPGDAATIAEDRSDGEGGLDHREHGVLSREDDGPPQSGVEGGCDLLPQARQLQADQVRPLPAGVLADGPQGRLRDGAPATRGAGVGALPAAPGGGASQQPQPAGQRAGEPDAVRQQSASQAVRGARFTSSDLARFDLVNYTGTVWCVEVPTGAFVARRNGKVFITGNSGFPKSLDVSKALDKRGGVSVAWFGPWLEQERTRRGITRKELAAHFPSKQQYGGQEASGGLTGCVSNWETGYSLPTPEQFNKLCEVLELPFTKIEEAEREVLIERTLVQGGGNSLELRMGERREVAAPITAPASTPAQEWSGWGTALKPAVENWWLCRKPFNGTVAENVLKHGTGALNIDGCRVGVGDESIHIPQSDPGKRGGVVGTDLGFSGGELAAFQAAQRASGERTKQLGRWPAHLVLSHTPECRCVGTKRVKGITGGFTPGSTGAFGQNHTYGQAEGAEHTPQYAGADGMETVEAWECASDCPVRLLDEQGYAKGAHSPCIVNPSNKRHVDPSVPVLQQKDRPNFDYGDAGGVSRFFYCPKPARRERNLGGVENKHPTVKALELMRWLVRMIAPPGGLVLDPFTGSGSTGCAAVLEGCQFLGFEREVEYLEIARGRIGYCVAHPEEFQPRPKKKAVRPHGRPPQPVAAPAAAPASADVNEWLTGLMAAVKG